MTFHIVSLMDFEDEDADPISHGWAVSDEQAEQIRAMLGEPQFEHLLSAKDVDQLSDNFPGVRGFPSESGGGTDG